MRARLASIFAVMAILLLAPSPSSAWPTLLPDTPDNGRPFVVTADAAGDVLVAGRALASTDDDGLLAKLRGSDGGVVWQQRFDGTAAPGPGGEDAAAETLRGLAITAGNDAVAAGLTVDATSGSDMLVTRRAASDGASLWQLTIDGGANLADNAQDVALDPSGDALVTGALTDTGATLLRPAVLKLAGATGVEAWRVLLTGDTGVGRAIRSDAAGDVFVAGDVSAAWFVTKRSGADGTEIWRTDLPGDPGDAVARALALRPGGASAVAGRLFTAAGGQDFAVIALDADGAEQWRFTLDGTAVDDADVDEAFGVAVDAASGDVVAAGVLSNLATDDDLVVVKIDGVTGGEKWSRVIDGSNSNDDDASAVALTPSGDVVVVGSIRNPGSGRDLAVLLLDGVTGAERWRRLVDGATSQGDVGFAGAVDGSGAVLAAGRTRNGAAADGFTVLKLASATGGDFPCGTGTLEEGEACDDANLVPGDGCRPDCTIEACGDGIRDPQETCDDGNTDDGDCCSGLCATDANGTPCDDADACTLDDACAGGTCQGVPTACEASNDCHEAACDPETGLCSEAPRSNGALCDDGDACTVVDECAAGECTPGGARPCNDFDPCTADSCAPATGCVFDPYTSFAGVSCAFDPTRIATFCFAGLPRSLERRIERATSRVAKAAESAKVGRARRLLKSACSLAHQAEKRAAKQTTRGDLSPACGAALADVLPDVCARALALRDEIAAGQ